jgi:hypothetical protein
MVGCLLSSLFLLAFIPSAAASGPIRVDDKFESGSLGSWRVEGDTRLCFTPALEHDEAHVNSAMTWFYGRLSNVLNREVTIQIEGLVYTVYNGRQGNILPFERNTVPVYSYDGEVWERFVDCGFDRQSRTYRIRHIFSRDVVWIAYIPPYTLGRLEALLHSMRTQPGVTIETMGESVEGRPLYLVNVGEPDRPDQNRPVVWVVARQHAFEAGGTWAVEGLLRFLTGSDPAAASVRNRLTFRLCPMLNPDGVTKGGTRFNARGVDLNRHWSEEDPLSKDSVTAPEIVLVKQAIRRWRASHRLDLWINIHNNDMVWNEDGDYIRFAPSRRADEARRLESILRNDTVFSGPFEPTTGSQATEAVVAADTGALSLLMEMKTGFLERQQRWTGVDVFLEQGRGLALAARKLLAEQP